MRTPFESFLKRLGIKYDIERNGNIVNSTDGLPNTEKSTNNKYIGFMPETDIKVNDVLINEAGERVYVTDVETSYIHNHQPMEIKAFFISEAEKNAIKNNSSVFNIQNAYNSIIGNQSIATVSYSDTINEMRKKANNETEDKEQIQTIINLLEMIVNDQVQPSKGIFSKFSSIMEKHSWLSSSIASALFSWAISGIIH